MKKYCFDLDNTLCFTQGNDYNSCFPITERIDIVNKLFDEGNEIIVYTARGMSSLNKDISKIYDSLYAKTKNQLLEWGLKHTVLVLGKPSYDYFICDKAYNSEDWFAQLNCVYNTGFIAGSFDVIHPGYIKMFQDCAKHCCKLFVGLHADPSLENGKKPPILTIQERKDVLLSLKYVYDVIEYSTEEELAQILIKNKYDVRFLGEDYMYKNFTAKEINMPIIFLDRSHGWSATKFKQLIYEQCKK
jgi:glycerol-3-phosphate cytidylyltransferase